MSTRSRLLTRRRADRRHHVAAGARADAGRRSRFRSRHTSVRRPRTRGAPAGSGPKRPGPAGREWLPHRPGERAAALLDARAAHVRSGGSGLGGTGLDPPAGVRADRSGAGVLPRAAAVASAREAVRRSRARRAAMRAPGAPARPASTGRQATGAVSAAEAVREDGVPPGTASVRGDEQVPDESEQVRDEPVRDEPVRDQPVGDEPVRDESVRDEPVGDEPVRDESVRETGTVRDAGRAYGPVGRSAGGPAVDGPVGGRGGAHGHRTAARGTRAPLAAGERTRLALRERLPLWVQLRCGIEARTLLALTVVLVVALGFAVHHFWTGRPEAVRAPSAERTPAGAGDVPRGGAGGASGDGSDPGRLSGKRLVVDVGGKVRKPGVHRLPSGSRVADALKAAGGVRPGTDLGGLNRARRLVDGEQIVAGAPAAPSAAGPSGGGGSAGPRGGGAASGGPGQGGVVSLSAATVEQLETLPGVGPVLAQHIVEYRQENGGFTSVDQLKEVNGIGDRRFADIEPKVSP